MDFEMKIRKATLEDSYIISEHLFLAMEDLLYVFIGMNNKNKAKELLLYFVQKEDNQYSFQNCLVAEKEDEVIGSINIYDGAKLEVLRAPFIQYIKTHFDENFNPEKETQPDEYYIDSFGVNPNHQGKGTGAKILEYAIKKHTIEQQQTLGLLVDEKNPAAKKLYLKLGFRPVGRKILAGIMMEHLQIKPTSSNE